MLDATQDAYRRTLKRWVGTMTVAVVLLAMAAAWYAFVAGDIEAFMIVVWYAPLLVGGAFLAISVYYLVLGVLAGRGPADAAASPRRPPNP